MGRQSRSSASVAPDRPLLRLRHLLSVAIISLSGLASLPTAPVASACSQPGPWSVAAAFDLAASGLLPPPYPQLPRSPATRTIPPSLLKAVGWVESGWRQFTPHGRPLVSFDFGYGIMQITSGMAGAFGSPAGSLDTATQSRIASDYVYNVAYGAYVLAGKWASTPQVGDGDPSVVEDWYYALWAYNGWGWVNNPNNPRFTRSGTPTSNPAGFPYQERVLYLVAHPPHDADGNPMWQPVPVSLPPRQEIGRHPTSLALQAVHRESTPALSAVYRVSVPPALAPGQAPTFLVDVINTGTEAWTATGSLAVGLSYHLLNASTDAWKPFSPFTPGVLAFGQGDVALPHDVLPGQSVHVKIQVQIPGKPGSYRLVWDLQQGSSTWFSQAGALPRAEVMRVLAASPTVTPRTSVTAAPKSVPRNSLRFVADTSIPDGTILAPRQSFLKGWLVQNNGKTAWSAGWKLQSVSGTTFGVRSIPIPATRACSSAVILVPLQAPRHVGNYAGAWQLTDDSGRHIGDRLTVVIAVKPGPQPGTPTPSTGPTPKPAHTPSAPTPTPTPIG